MTQLKSRLVPLLVLVTALALTAFAYLPGLHGSFLFDDYANLPALGKTGPITHWETFWRYITSGNADPTGRPIALLSFLLDAQNWPASPHPFKRTNLILHLVNGLLLFLLLRRLGNAYSAPTPSRLRADLAAALGASLWLAHPLLVSTTLYIVQREAMLPATFTLLGLLGWFHGRQRMRDGAIWPGLAWIAIGLGLGTFLAILSKANGILLPAFALIIECTLLQCRQPNRMPPAYVRAMWLFAGIPCLLVAAYLAHAGWKGITAGIADTRPWTLAQRLLTEPRVLLTYLHMLWLPTPFTAGLFNDQVKASASLLHPWTTLPSIIVVAALIVAAWCGRRRAPVLSAAILFFFVGQSIESSTIALELFFEHRNYLPAMLMFWPLAWWLCHATPSVPPSGRESNGGAGTQDRLRAILATVCLAGVLAMTWSRAALWGNTHDQALLWARLNPASARAQAFAAQAEVAAGHPEQAIQRLQPALQSDPDEVQLALNLVAARCAAGNLDGRTLDSAERALHTARDSGSLLASWFGRAIRQASIGSCPELDMDRIDRLLVAAKRNPWLARNPGRQQDVDYLRGHIAIKRQQPERALELFNEGLREQPRPSLALSQAAEFGMAGFPAQGLAHLDYFDSLTAPPRAHGWNMRGLHAWVLARQQYWPREIARLRATLQQDLTAHQKHSE